MSRTPFFRWACSLCLWMSLAGVSGAWAAMQDEIQVYTDEINEPGERGIELHVNTTPKGVTTPSYPGEVINDHGWRVTPEFSLGLTKTTDIGLYVPTVRSNDGNLYAAGFKMRFKWLPIQSSDTGGFLPALILNWVRCVSGFPSRPGLAKQPMAGGGLGRPRSGPECGRGQRHHVSVRPVDRESNCGVCVRPLTRRPRTAQRTDQVYGHQASRCGSLQFSQRQSAAVGNWRAIHIERH